MVKDKETEIVGDGGRERWRWGRWGGEGEGDERRCQLSKK